MDNQSRPALKLVGNSASNGGVFGQVKITGECEFRGDLDCGKLACTGSVAVRGGLTAAAVKLTGTCGVETDLVSGEIGGTGELKVKGGLRSEKVRLNGQLAVDKDAELGDAVLRGAIVCGGLLSADRLELGLFGPSSVGELGGGRLRVRRSRMGALKNWVSSGGAASLKAGTIEGDQVELQYTEADVVKGGDVVIGPGCKIGRVEYSRELRVDSRAQVGQRVRI